MAKVLVDQKLLPAKKFLVRNKSSLKISTKWHETKQKLGLFPPNPEIAGESSAAKVLVGGKLSPREVYPPKLSCINHFVGSQNIFSQKIHSLQKLQKLLALII